MSELPKKDGGVMLSTFPDVAVALRISDTSNKQMWRREIILNTNTCKEPSPEHHEPLAALSLLCIESDVVRELDCAELINDFALFKCRRRICKDWGALLVLRVTADDLTE